MSRTASSELVVLSKFEYSAYYFRRCNLVGACDYVPLELFGHGNGRKMGCVDADDARGGSMMHAAADADDAGA